MLFEIFVSKLVMGENGIEKKIIKRYSCPSEKKVVELLKTSILHLSNASTLKVRAFGVEELFDVEVYTDFTSEGSVLKYWDYHPPTVNPKKISDFFNLGARMSVHDTIYVFNSYLYDFIDIDESDVGAKFALASMAVGEIDLPEEAYGFLDSMKDPVVSFIEDILFFKTEDEVFEYLRDILGPRVMRESMTDDLPYNLDGAILLERRDDGKITVREGLTVSSGNTTVNSYFESKKIENIKESGAYKLLFSMTDVIDETMNAMGD